MAPYLETMTQSRASASDEVLDLKKLRRYQGLRPAHRRRREAGSGLAVLNSSTSRGVALSALTNVVSCGSLALSSHHGTASMGEFLTLALLLTLATSLVVLPALLEFLDRPRRVVTPS